MALKIEDYLPKKKEIRNVQARIEKDIADRMDRVCSENDWSLVEFMEAAFSFYLDKLEAREHPKAKRG